MVKAIALAAVCALLAGWTAALPVARAGELPAGLWAERGDIGKAMEAIEIYEAQARAKPGDYVTLVRLSRLHHWVGINLEPKDEQGALSHFERGEAVAGKAIEADPRRAAGYFFKAANAAERSEVEGRLKSLLRGAEVRAMAEKALSIDPKFFYGGPERLLCSYYTDLPGVLGGNLSKAVELGKRAVAANPDFAGNRVCLAEAYFKEGKNDLARKELQLAIATADNAVPDAIPEQKLEKGRAVELLKKIGK